MVDAEGKWTKSWPLWHTMFESYRSCLKWAGCCPFNFDLFISVYQLWLDPLQCLSSDPHSARQSFDKNGDKLCPRQLTCQVAPTPLPSIGLLPSRYNDFDKRCFSAMMADMQLFLKLSFGCWISLVTTTISISIERNGRFETSFQTRFDYGYLLGPCVVNVDK